jgi:hypothetical protein
MEYGVQTLIWSMKFGLWPNCLYFKFERKVKSYIFTTQFQMETNMNYKPF